MANRLKMALIDSITTLHKQGWSQRRIARELGINRESVSRHLRQALLESKPANAPTGSAAGAEQSKPAIAPTGSDTGTAAPKVRRAGRLSDCEQYRQLIVGWCEQGLHCQRIYQDLLTEHGYRGSYYSVRRFVHRLQRVSELPMRRLECEPGEEVQVDFGRGAFVVEQDKRRRPHVFRVVLSYSRKGYSEVVSRQTTEAFLRCLENAFWHFGGVPRRIVLDNLRAAVSHADWFDPELNPKVQAFARHYGTVFWPTRPYTPRHKGKVERGVDYVQRNALKGRTFVSLDAQNRHLADWEQNVADTRIHGTTKRHVGLVFREVEQAALLALPLARFPLFHEAPRTVHRDGHIEVARAYYSVPPEYLGKRLWVRWDGRLVRIFNDRLEQIALHVQHEAGRFSTQDQHLANEKISSVERGASWLLGRVRHIGPQTTRWAEALVQARGVEAVRVLQGLLGLTKRHASAALERACGIAHSHGDYRLRTLRRLLERDAPRQELFAFAEQDPVIRPLSEYTQFVHDAFQKGATS
jgi:transposase